MGLVRQLRGKEECHKLDGLSSVSGTNIVRRENSHKLFSDIHTMWKRGGDKQYFLNLPIIGVSSALPRGF